MINNNTNFNNRNIENTPQTGAVSKIYNNLKPIPEGTIKSLNRNDNFSSDTNLKKGDIQNPIKLTENSNEGDVSNSLRAGESDKDSATTKKARQSFNKMIFDHFLEYKEDKDYKPTISKLDLIANSGIDIKSFEKEAMRSTIKTNARTNGLQSVKMAYRSAMVSTITNSYSDPNFFNGEKDKSLHYFTSASLTTEIYDAIPILPKSVKRSIAGGTVLAIGWLKEVASIPGTGFSKEDMAANTAGIDSAKEYLKALDK